MIYATPCSPRSSIRGRLGGTSWPSSSAAFHAPSTCPAAHYTGRSARRSCAGHDAGISPRPGYATKRGARYPGGFGRLGTPAQPGRVSSRRIWAEWPEVLVDLRDAVFTPLIHSGTPRGDIVALLKRRAPHPVDIHRGSLHRQVRAQIVRWARRWHLTAPGIRDEAWRTLSWWARWARDSRPAGRAFGWAPLVSTTPRSIAPIEPCPPRIPPSAPLVSTTPRTIAPPTPTLLRPRDCGGLIWLVRHRVWPTPASLEDLANGVTERGHVTPNAVRGAVNFLAHELDLPVRRRGRPRAARSRAPSPRA